MEYLSRFISNTPGDPGAGDFKTQNTPGWGIFFSPWVWHLYTYLDKIHRQHQRRGKSHTCPPAPSRHDHHGQLRTKGCGQKLSVMSEVYQNNNSEKEIAYSLMIWHFKTLSNGFGVTFLFYFLNNFLLPEIHSIYTIWLFTIFINSTYYCQINSFRTN